MPTETNIEQLVINKLTQAKYDELDAAGQVLLDQLYLITDGETNAINVIYNNQKTKLKATNVQDAIDEINAKIGSGSQTAVLYTPQELTDEQEKQARVNIGIPSYGPEDEGKVLGIVGGKLMWIAGGTPPPEKPVYGNPVTDKSSLKLVAGSSSALGIKLDKKPTQSQTVSIITTSEFLSVSIPKIEFTAENWNAYQYVDVMASSLATAGETSVTLRNSDPLMTDSFIPVQISTEGYPVDTAIPKTDQHILTADDFEKTNEFQGHIRLYNYKSTYTNVVVPKQITGLIPWIIPNITFPKEATKLKYLTFEGEYWLASAGQPGGVNGDLAGMTDLIGVSNLSLKTTSLSFSGCTSLKFVDNLPNLTNVKSMYFAFADCANLEYLQDLSKITMTGAGSITGAFKGAVKLRKVFGMPKVSSAEKVNSNNIFNGCTALESAEIPENINNMQYAFNQCKNLKTVKIYEKELTIAMLNGAFNGHGERIDVYAPGNSLTFKTLVEMYSSDTAVHIYPFGGEELPNMVAWGDSTTSPNRSWIEWPARLIKKVPGYALRNQALSGEYTPSTAGRQGGNTLSVSKFTIPAETTEAEIVLKPKYGDVFSKQPIFSPGAAFNPCKIAGVDGTISGSGGKYYFTRNVAGSAVEVQNGSIVTSNSDLLFNNPDAIMLINLGINAGWSVGDRLSADLLLQQVQSMVDHFKTKGGTKYIVTGPYAGQNLESEAARTQVFAYEEKASAAFGTNWLNLRKYLIQNGLKENGLSETESDKTRIALGCVPGSLLGAGGTIDIPMYPETSDDLTHPNAYGQNSISLAFYQKGQELGYWA